jgi:hypothetical protein
LELRRVVGGRPREIHDLPLEPVVSVAAGGSERGR